MRTFGEFSLLRTVPSYGGAEVLRARRCRGGAMGPPIHLALYGQAGVEHRLVAAAEAVDQARHERVGRIHEVGRSDGSLYAVAEPVEGLDLFSLLEHERARRGALEPELCVAVSLALALLATELMDRDVWAGARGAGISSLFAAGLRLDGVVLGDDGIWLRPLAGAADDAARPTAYRAPEVSSRHTPASAATDVFLIAQIMRALCAVDAGATSAPRPGPATAVLAPLLAAGLAPAVDERLGLHLLVEELARLLREATGERAPAGVIGRALAGAYRALVPLAPSDPSLPVPEAAAGPLPPPVAVLWPAEPEDDARTVQSMPLVHLRTQPSDSEAVGRVFTEEGAAAPTAARLEIGQAGAFADETTQKLPAQPAPPPGRATQLSDPPWASLSDIEPLEASGKRPPAAPVAIPSELEGGPTVEMRSPFDESKGPDDDEKTELRALPELPEQPGGPTKGE